MTPVPNNGTEGMLYDILIAPPSLPGVPGSPDYAATCDYPDPDTYEERANLTTSGCSCDKSQVNHLALGLWLL